MGVTHDDSDGAALARNSSRLDRTERGTRQGRQPDHRWYADELVQPARLSRDQERRDRQLRGRRGRCARARNLLRRWVPPHGSDQRRSRRAGSRSRGAGLGQGQHAAPDPRPATARARLRGHRRRRTARPEAGRHHRHPAWQGVGRPRHADRRGAVEPPPLQMRRLEPGRQHELRVRLVRRGHRRHSPAGAHDGQGSHKRPAAAPSHAARRSRRSATA